MDDDKTILIVDDTVANLDLLAELLDNYDIIDATSGEEALEILEEEKVDLILLDIMMPGMDGFEVCRRLREKPETKEIPIIFITAKNDEDSIEKAYDIGGSDYITKPFKPKELRARVKMQLKLQELKNELKILASTDPMTGLYNRRHFACVAEHTINLARREKKSVSVILLDIDRFKKINDTYGHNVGDEVIIRLAQILKKNKRASDVCCRFGGEEFVILLPNTDLKGAVTLAQNLRNIVEGVVMEAPNGGEFNFTISAGVSSVDILNEPTVEDAIRRADEALYKAKETGRNRVCEKGV